MVASLAPATPLRFSTRRRLQDGRVLVGLPGHVVLEAVEEDVAEKQGGGQSHDARRRRGW